jgi:hypothetical protein
MISSNGSNMKMTRQDLKGLVKECLVEILSEGLVETQRTLTEARQVATPKLSGSEQHNATAARPRTSTADKISFLPKKEEMRRATTPDNSHHLARSLTSDPVLADIFADTARSGAHRQMNESSAGVRHEQMVATAGDKAAKMMLQSDPTDVFGDAAGKWASLAFAEKIPTRA